MIPFGLTAGQVKVAAAALILSGAVFSGWYARGIWYDAQKADELQGQLDVIHDSIARAETAAWQAFEAIGKIKVENKTIKQEIRHETETREVFRNDACVLPVTTFRLLNYALTRKGDRPSQLDGALPGLAPFAQPDVRRSGGEAGGGGGDVPSLR